MILNPAIIALIGGSALVSAFALYASLVGIQVLRRWDIATGSELQLKLERKTYLISTILSYLLAFQLFSLFLFIYTADHMHSLFVGAMCAAGSLNVNDYGYPTLVLKMFNVFLCGVWLVVNSIDNRAEDYPLIKSKYKFLLFITASLLVETLLLTGYFAGLKADVITSCCGRLFSEHAETIAGELSAFPPRTAKILFFLVLVLTLRTGIRFFRTGRAARTFSFFSTAAMVFSFGAVISFISLYFYQLPTHHCPFCLLQKEYGYIGYPLYFSLFLAGISGAGVGVMDRFKEIPSLRQIMPGSQKALCLISMIGYSVFVTLSLYPMVSSDFVLEG
jgi:hypothetical protein